MSQIIYCDGDDVMDTSILNFIPWDSKVASSISNDDVVTKLLPLDRVVKRLVLVAIAAEGSIANSLRCLEIA